MAGFHSDVFSTIKNRLLDWLQFANTGGNVSDLALDLLNRAQRELWNYRAWEYSVRRVTLTVSNKVATLPAGFGKVLRVFSDTNGDGLPDFYYYNRSSRADDGYYLTDSFAKATGHSWTMTFWSAPQNTVTLEYQIILDDFNGAETEYSFFPGELLLVRAQKIHITEAALVGNDYTAIMNREKELLLDYEHAHHYRNVDPRMELSDENGTQIENEEFDLGGGTGAAANSFDNSYDNGY